MGEEQLLLVDNKQGGGSPFSPQMQAGNAQVPSPLNGNMYYPQGAETFAPLILAARRGAQLPAWGTKARDIKLREFLRDSDNLISAVVYGEVARVQNTSWTIVSDTADTSQVEDWHRKLNQANFNKGFRDFTGAIALDYLSQDNGVFIEYVVEDGINRTHLPLGDEQIVGIATLDSAQCYRTYDPEYPMVYYNPWNRQYYVYHYTKVVMIAQFAQNNEMAMGLGLCAVSRAYSAASLVKEAHIYMYEKISGAEPEIVFVSGVGHKTLENALGAVQTQAAMRGATRYKGVVFIAPPSVGPNFPEVKTHMVGLKSVPDGWKHGEEIDLAIYKIALAFGLDAREIWPATQSGATKGDADIQDRKTSAKGRTEVMRAIEYILNHFILPKGLTFRFDDVNIKEQLETERLRRARADRFKTLVDAGVLLPDEVRTMLAAIGDIDRRYAPGVMDNEITEMDDGLELVVGATEEDARVNPTANKELSKTRAFFNRTLSNIVDASLSIGFFRFVAEMDNLIRLAGEMAFIDGLNDGGYPATFGALPREFLGIFNQAVADQQEHVTGFAVAVVNAQDDTARAKIDLRKDLWLNKCIGELYMLGFMLAQSERHLKWVLGPTEHCTTCLGASGEVHTARQWLAMGIFPRSSRLECGGYECQCSFEETDEPLTGNFEELNLQNGLTYQAPQSWVSKFFGRFR